MIAAAAENAGSIDWGSCLLLAMPLLLVIWVLSPIAPRRSAGGNRVFGISLVVGGLALIAAVR